LPQQPCVSIPERIRFTLETLGLARWEKSGAPRKNKSSQRLSTAYQGDLYPVYVAPKLDYS